MHCFVGESQQCFELFEILVFKIQIQNISLKFNAYLELHMKMYLENGMLVALIQFKAWNVRTLSGNTWRREHVKNLYVVSFHSSVFNRHINFVGFFLLYGI